MSNLSNTQSEEKDMFIVDAQSAVAGIPPDPPVGSSASLQEVIWDLTALAEELACCPCPLCGCAGP